MASLAPRDVLYHAGDRADGLYLVLSGKVLVVRESATRSAMPFSTLRSFAPALEDYRRLENLAGAYLIGTELKLTVALVTIVAVLTIPFGN